LFARHAEPRLRRFNLGLRAEGRAIRRGRSVGRQSVPCWTGPQSNTKCKFARPRAVGYCQSHNGGLNYHVYPRMPPCYAGTPRLHLQRCEEERTDDADHERRWRYLVVFGGWWLPALERDMEEPGRNPYCIESTTWQACLDSTLLKDGKAAPPGSCRPPAGAATTMQCGR
jgi:hypothetical protein